MNEEEEDNPLESPSPPRNGGASSPVEMSPPPPQSPSPVSDHCRDLALPAQQLRSSNGGREDCWSEFATEVLIDAWGERYLELSRGNLRQKHWQEVADIVSSRCGYKKAPKTDVQCKNRIDTVKKKYKVEKSKIVAGGVSTWSLFEKLDGLIGPSGKNPLPSANKLTVFKKKKKKKKKMESEDEEEDDGGEGDDGGAFESDDGFPPPRKRAAAVAGRRHEVLCLEKMKDGCSFRVLSEAITRFGEAYERAENAKLAQVVEMEKMRMKFMKEVEIQRMQFFMKSQMEMAHLCRRVDAKRHRSDHLNAPSDDPNDSKDRGTDAL